MGLEGKPLWLEERRCSYPWPNEFKILLHHSMELKEGRRHFVMGLRSSVWSVQVPQDSPVSGEQPEVEGLCRGLYMVCWYRHQQRCHSGHLVLALANCPKGDTLSQFRRRVKHRKGALPRLCYDCERSWE